VKDRYKPSHCVYGFATEGFTKIGMTERFVVRMGTIQCVCPFPVRPVFRYFANDRKHAAKIEKWLHSLLAEHLHKNEWFVDSAKFREQLAHILETMC